MHPTILRVSHLYLLLPSLSPTDPFRESPAGFSSSQSVLDSLSFFPPTHLSQESVGSKDVFKPALHNDAFSYTGTPLT